MRHLDVGLEMVRFPDMQNWTTWDLVLVFLMWAIIMVGMMVPAASPVILLFAEINRRRNGHQSTFVQPDNSCWGYRRRGRALARGNPKDRSVFLAGDMLILVRRS